MGDDGHTASLFPGEAGLAAGLDASAPPGCLEMHSPQAPRPRLSLNLAALLHARRIYVQIMGAQKWQVYQRARAAGEVAEMPIRAILQQSAVPIDVYWCPDAAAGPAAWTLPDAGLQRRTPRRAGPRSCLVWPQGRPRRR